MSSNNHSRILVSNLISWLLRVILKGHICLRLFPKRLFVNANGYVKEKSAGSVVVLLHDITFVFWVLGEKVLACRSANGGWRLWPHNIFVFLAAPCLQLLPHDEANLKFCDLPAIQASHIHIIILTPAIILLPSFLQRNISSSSSRSTAKPPRIIL